MGSRYDNIPRLEPFGKSQLGNKYPRKGNENARRDLEDQIATVLSQTSTDTRKMTEILYLVEESLWLGQIVAKAELRGREQDHTVILSEADVRKFREWLERPNGSFVGNGRFSADSGGGALHVHTRPFSYEEQYGKRS